MLVDSKIVLVEDWPGDSVVIVSTTSDSDSIEELLATLPMVDEDIGRPVAVVAIVVGEVLLMITRSESSAVAELGVSEVDRGASSVEGRVEIGPGLAVVGVEELIRTGIILLVVEGVGLEIFRETPSVGFLSPGVEE